MSEVEWDAELEFFWNPVCCWEADRQNGVGEEGVGEHARKLDRFGKRGGGELITVVNENVRIVRLCCDVDFEDLDEQLVGEVRSSLLRVRRDRQI